MATIDPTGLDIGDPKAVQHRMARLRNDVRLEACGVAQAEKAFFEAMLRLLERDPGLYRRTLLGFLSAYGVDFIDSPAVPMLGKRRRWRRLRRELRDAMRTVFGDAVTRKYAGRRARREEE